ncbi:MAG: hypothetical protein NTAFB01_13310 [Nitrospira sp.]
MASDERLRQQGLLLDKEQRARHVAVNIYGLKDRVRSLVDKHKSIELLDTEALSVAVTELANADREFETLKTEIRLLRDDLGLPPEEIR